MAKENPENNTQAEKLKALQAAMSKIEKDFGKGSIMKMGDEIVENVEVIPTEHRTQCRPRRGRLSQRTHHRNLWTGVVG